ncbi:MAG TPA: hypothetical protein VFE01_07095 [Terracidiphilus sp.]|nr:hypothetical protein [Terracidiphilus sp.]
MEDVRTWIEETGLCLFLPRRQFSNSVAPSFVEAVAGRPEATPDQKTITHAEDLLIRLENEGVAVRLNLQGQPGEQPDFVVASWVLPYVYALRGDRDWRRSPQLTGSRQVSQLAVHVYKQLESGDQNVSQLKQALGREVSESAVIRAITELWQQLRIIPVIAARGQAAKWQLLRTRFQRAIAEGASTSQVTAISVLSSIYLQAVIAASMEEVEFFLAALTARSKIREVIRGLVATRQVHTLSLGHAPHFYVAGTLPEFEPASSLYANSTLSASSYFSRSFDRDDETPRRAISVPFPQQPAAFQPRPPATTTVSAPAPVPAAAPIQEPEIAPHHPARTPVRRPVTSSKPETARPHFNRPASRKPAASSRPASTNGHAARHTSDPRKKSGARPSSETRWNGTKNGKHTHASNGHAAGSRGRTTNGTSSTRPANGTSANRPGTGATSNRAGNGTGSTRAAKPTSQSWTKRAGTTKPKSAASRTEARPARKTRPALTAAGRSSANGKRFFNSRSKPGTKKRG